MPAGFFGKTRACSGIVGYADLLLGSRVEPVLAAHIRAGGDRFRGIRHITAWDADTSLNNPAFPAPPGLLADKTFREGFTALERLGLSFDAWMYHPQLENLAALAGAFPETRIVLNHVGGPIGRGAYSGKRNEVFSRLGGINQGPRPPPERFHQGGWTRSGINDFGFDKQTEPPTSDLLATTWRPLR